MMNITTNFDGSYQSKICLKEMSGNLTLYMHNIQLTHTFMQHSSEQNIENIHSISEDNLYVEGPLGETSCSSSISLNSHEKNSRNLSPSEGTPLDSIHIYVLGSSTGGV